MKQIMWAIWLFVAVLMVPACSLDTLASTSWVRNTWLRRGARNGFAIPGVHHQKPKTIGAPWPKTTIQPPPQSREHAKYNGAVVLALQQLQQSPVLPKTDCSLTRCDSVESDVYWKKVSAMNEVLPLGTQEHILKILIDTYDPRTKRMDLTGKLLQHRRTQRENAADADSPAKKHDLDLFQSYERLIQMMATLFPPFNEIEVLILDANMLCYQRLEWNLLPPNLKVFSMLGAIHLAGIPELKFVQDMKAGAFACVPKLEEIYVGPRAISDYFIQHAVKEKYNCLPNLKSLSV